MDRSRRANKSKLDKLAAYKRAREGGSRAIAFEEDDGVLYDEVSEEQYKQIVKGRLAKDDFVVDDGVEGYMDNGMDDWGNGGTDEEDDEEEQRKPRKSGKSSSKVADGPSKKAKPKAPPPAVQPMSMAAYRPTVSADQENDFMSSLLGAMDSLPTEAPTKPRNKKRKSEMVRDNSPPRANGSYRSKQYAYADSSSDGPEPPSDDYVLSPKKKSRTHDYTNGISDDGMTPSMERMGVKSDNEGTDGGFSAGASDFDVDATFDEIDMEAFMEVDEEELKPNVKKVVKKEEVELDLKKPLKPLNGVPPAHPPTNAKKEDDAKPSWLSVYDGLTVAPAAEPLGSTKMSSNSSNFEVLEDDGSLRFFWLDYMEHEGKLYFIGKLKEKTSGQWVSICVTIENLQRNLFVLPRALRVEQDEDGNLVETDVPVEMSDVYSDFDQIRQQAGIKSWRCKPVKRKYAFGEPDVPRDEAEWLKVVYPFEEPTIPSTVSSPNFSRIFGTNTTAFELLVLKRKIMGPCWLNIKHPKVEHKGISWCKVEATVSDPKDINPFAESDADAPKDTPPLTITSLSLRTIVNHKENKREIVCATARIWSNIQIDDPTPPEQLPCTVHTFVRPLGRFPPNFEARAKANGKGVISPMANERMLLSSLLVTIHKADPDVFVGHEFLGVSLDVLLNRMKELKADHWSRISRFRRSRWPNIGRQGSNLRFLAGRMLCDLASDGAKSMISSTTWSLTEMCKTHLKSDRQDIDPDDTAAYFDGSVSSPDRLLTFVRHCELDAHYQMAIASKVQILPLTRQLTNLAGNSWNKTLNGGRAERNEYILLHEFHRLKYICPDKTWGKKAAAAVKAEAEGDDPNGATVGGKGKGKRDKYKGGLVFEPKRGLWDKFILVMDFNSLYPSIIQEYNIDFTTVEPVEDDEDGEERIPDPPDSTTAQGVLPRLIATLVNRRRQVKALMKDKTASQAKLMQYDIKQQALKLTANSMYGCLGFEYSRFYARPLAALTTFKGREILTATRELAESLQLDVVYGDTDSVFVNSGATDLAEALKIAADFKKAVNERYRLLEIDLDGIFQRLLLLQKKKYAAIKVEDGTRTSTEVKGLDMKRREYCALSKNVSQYVLEQILSGEATEIVVEQIHDYLTTIGQNVREGKIKLDDFIVFKRLGKNPEDYPDAKSQPHVQVALRMKTRGGTARSGDVIPYVFCLGASGESSKTGQADKAKHPDEVRKGGKDCQIDYEYYLSQQVLPPIERLCEPIEGTDRARLAECLGLDPGRFRTSTSGEVQEHVFTTLDSQMSDAERFKDTDPFVVRCRKCEGQIAFAPVADRTASLLLPSGPECPACKAPMTTASLQVQLDTQIRAHIARYYEGWIVCNDQTCGMRTRMMGVYARTCLRKDCTSTVAFEYSDAELYNQLRMYHSLFDQQKIIKAARGMDKDKLMEIDTLCTMQAGLLQTLLDTVEKYMLQSGRRWVDMSSLFSFMKV
ncbi:DNA polymerase alpha catalytic subunit [Punctularia strigosozonata HHB-11173 SS5]|uniref:DNA polymerase n=1 Tax=Punctularia strigosozonata (strain HHB-11173) TaxID=741275 RepID=R7S3V2_PUNST|nr:DNA polymerase alpha catalytic subunit [Punctularia strigosozonata HHB-11173 SS5]EIN03911.1 DNA polymerase alpha catalytic subunit [Punctularia strigosozonata HHB-11173 SS5]